jgi:acetyl esterase/lipase
MKNFLDSGIACVSVEYRLTKGKSTVVDAVADCKDAGRYLVKHASDLGFDTDRMGVWGGSAGGHLSLMTGLTNSDDFKGDPALAGIRPSYKCIVSYYPQTTLTVPEVVHGTKYLNTDRLSKMLGPGQSLDSEVARKLSPVEYIRKDNPPVLLIHGTADSTLSFKNAVYYMARAKEQGSEAELIAAVNGGHGGFSGKTVKPTLEEITKRASDFIVRKLLYK